MSTSQIAQGVRTVYTNTTVGVTNWVVLFPSLPYTVTSIDIFDSSGQTLEIGTCDASATSNSEIRQFLIFPGGCGPNKVQINSSQRISIRAVSNAASEGENDANIFF